MRTLIQCDNDFEARLIVGRLENEGIKAVVLNEYIHNVLPYLNSNADAFSVQVSEEEYDRAFAIIHSEAPLDEVASTSNS